MTDLQCKFSVWRGTLYIRLVQFPEDLWHADTLLITLYRQRMENKNANTITHPSNAVQCKCLA